jgi:hypothetical protein
MELRGWLFALGLLGACALPVDLGGYRVCDLDADCRDNQLCENGLCTACPGPSAGCPAPLNQLPLSRHGCPTCTFAPPSQCLSPTDCAGGSVCVVGERCAAGCSGDLSCCANACAPKACVVTTAPVGCTMACGSLSCAHCVAAQCTCAGGDTWACTPLCTDATFDAGCSL